MVSFVITIDGPAASGKSTAARLLAKHLKASFLDTGAMYRAVTLAAMQGGTDMTDEEKLLGVLDNTQFKFAAEEGEMTVYVNGIDVTEQIRSPEVTANSRYIASAPKLRDRLVKMQREFASGEEKIVTEGRDQGTVAFPDANIKFFLVADLTERARRRQSELCGGGIKENLEQIKKNIEQRDKSDQTRTVGPLKPADGAVVIDTTDFSIEQTLEKLLGCIEKKSKKKPKMRWFRFARMLCRIFCELFFKLSVYGKENVPEEDPLLLISNHQSFFDPVLCGIYLKRPLYFLARDTLWKNRLFGKIISSVNTIPVRRGEADLSAMRTVIEKLKEGNGVCLFPEATRSKDGKISPFKPGFGLLCKRGKAAVVPVVIDGAFECWPRHKKFFSPGSKITISYGKCITAEQIERMDAKQLAENLTETLRKMQNDCRIKQGKETYDY